MTPAAGDSSGERYEVWGGPHGPWIVTPDQGVTVTESYGTREDAIAARDVLNAARLASVVDAELTPTIIDWASKGAANSPLTHFRIRTICNSLLAIAAAAALGRQRGNEKP